MANYSQLKAAIADVIKTNGTQAITGQVLQDVLNSMVSVIGANYTFAGVATPSTNPGTPDQNVVYFATQEGTYTNFGGVELPAGIHLLLWNGSWSTQTFFGIDNVPTKESANLVTSNGIFNKDINSIGFPLSRSVSDYNIIANSSEMETIRRKVFNPYFESFGITKTMYHYDIIDNVISEHSYNVINVIKVNKGDVVRVSAEQNGAGNTSQAIFYFTNQTPSLNLEVNSLNIAKSLYDGKHVNFILEASENGYFLVRRVPRNTITFKVFKRMDFSAILISNYSRQTLTLSPIIGKVIDVDETSQTYGDAITISSSSYGCTGFVDIEGYSYLFLRFVSTTSSAFYNLQGGLAFYDSDKNILSAITTVWYDGTSEIHYNFVSVPANAKYFRYTSYCSPDSLGNRTLFPELYAYKLEDTEEKDLYNGIVEGVLNGSMYETKSVTIIPSVADTRNAYYRETFPTNMKADNDVNSKYLQRLTYFPNYIVGGGELTIKYSGNLGSLRLFQLPYIPLNTSIVDAFKSSDVINMIYIPLSPSPDFTGEYTITLNEKCRRIAFVWGAGMGINLNPNNILNYIQEITLPVIDDSSIKLIGSGVVQGQSYYGERISFNNMYEYKLYASNSISGQSAAIYGDYLFIPKDKLVSISLYDMKKKELVYTYTTGFDKDATWHCNQCQFGIDKYSEDDMFPLLWISVNNNDDGRCSWVSYRIIPVLDEEGNITSFSISEVQTIYLPAMTDENCLGNVNIAVDYENKCFWGYGRNNNSEATNYLKAHFWRFPIPALFDSGNNLIPTVTYEDSDIVDQFADEWSMAYAQGGFIKNGKLLIMQGYSSVNLINCRVIDLYFAKKQVSYINLLADGFTQEPEGVFYYNGSVFTSTNNTNIHQFDFN